MKSESGTKDFRVKRNEPIESVVPITSEAFLTFFSQFVVGQGCLKYYFVQLQVSGQTNATDALYRNP